MFALKIRNFDKQSRALNSRTSRVRYVNSEISGCCFESCNGETTESRGKLLDASMCSKRFCNTFVPSKSCSKAHKFCSQAGAEHDDVFPVLRARQGAVEESAVEESASGDEMDDEFTLGESLADDTEADVGKEKTHKIRAPSGMTRAILADTRLPVSKALEKWVEAGNEVTLAEVSTNILYFRKRRMFSQALQLSEWLESSKLTELTESNYASRVDLIAKVRGIVEAEKYIQQIIPESLRTEVVYRTLLAACGTAVDVNKAEELFSKMKELFPISCFSCDQLLLLYKRTNRNKIADVLSLMKRENIKRSSFTYKILIDAKWQSGHISGIERLFEEMKSDGLEPSMHILASVAKSYLDNGLKAKAKAVLKDMEGGDLTENRWACRFLLPIYGSLGREDEVERIWRECESNPDMAECIAGIQAWGRLNRIEDAEAVFNKLLRIVRRPSSKHYSLMLNMYADNKMLDKGEEVVKRMTESGVTITPPAWRALVNLYARGGEVGRAESILQKGLGGRRGMHLLGAFLSILDAYAEKGDVQNAERMFLKMKRTGFTSSARPYRSLLYAYINAKVPAYGLRERMKSDNIIPDQKLAGLLARASKLDGLGVNKDI
ncbi:pentatricopeptide repeat-containing protein At1g80270, mitochondrial-like isoform X2 [Salvia hispanica]|uniref:pentatricopeptide repeat-containing protein At1g80270, mitochondrial-like isoform X2 n=1 Tax=Salvia hispanica TaxID=49212 RepID=UPI002009CBEE|nr:pentatricopeptide repeat-containing protein At1g80270, mitochondrial-like isoform X2 [Salvia hispanica]